MGDCVIHTLATVTLPLLSVYMKHIYTTEKLQTVSIILTCEAKSERVQNV